MTLAEFKEATKFLPDNTKLMVEELEFETDNTISVTGTYNVEVKDLGGDKKVMIQFQTMTELND